MKKFMMILSVALFAVMPAMAKDKITHDINKLPQAAKTMIAQNFKAKIHHIKIDEELLKSTEYDVVLSDGTEIEFDSKGNWKSVDCGKNAVPEKLVIKPILDYVKKNYAGQKIVDISKGSKKYEVELTSGIDLEFDRAGNFIKEDN